MNSVLRVTAVITTLLASVALFETASAQTAIPPRQGHIIPTPAAPPANAPPFRNAITGYNANAPRFIVEAISFLAIDESGLDLPRTSDEVFGVFNAGDRQMVTKTFGDVDTGEDRELDATQTCILPANDPDNQENGAWGCDRGGVAGPLRFRIRLFDEDVGYGDLRGDFCINLSHSDLAGCFLDGHHTTLFDNEFTYETSQILSRLRPDCQCFTEVAEQSQDSHTRYQITFRITRVNTNSGNSAGMATFNDDPVVYHGGSLGISTPESFDLDAGAVTPTGADFQFTRAGSVLRLTPQGGAKIWVGNNTARGYATCYAERASANYVSTVITAPPTGSYACYVTSDGRVGEFLVTNLMPILGGNGRLDINYTTWQ